MNYSTIELPTKKNSAFKAGPFVSALHANARNNLYCGLMFSNPTLLEVKLSPDGGFLSFEDLELEASLGDKGFFGVGHGLRGSVSGDTALVAYHLGFLPAVIRSILGGRFESKSLQEVRSFLLNQDEGMGAFVRHSIVQIVNYEFRVRRFKDPGMVWDVAHIGDFIFGLLGQSIWREPYLHTEKRETLRKDLANNFYLHKDRSEEGLFWFLGQNGRFLRMSLTDIKAKPTPIKAGDTSGIQSSCAAVDGWLYFASRSGKLLSRIRRNPVTLEEESQIVHEFEVPIRGMCHVDKSDIQGRVVLSLERKEGAEVLTFDTLKLEDPESLPPIPKIHSVGLVGGVSHLSNLAPRYTVSANAENQPDKPVDVWGGEGSWWAEENSKVPRLVQIKL